MDRLLRVAGLTLAGATFLAAACSGSNAKGVAVTFNEAAWTPPLEKDIPNDSLGASISFSISASISSESL